MLDKCDSGWTQGLALHGSNWVVAQWVELSGGFGAQVQWVSSVQSRDKKSQCSVKTWHIVIWWSALTEATPYHLSSSSSCETMCTCHILTYCFIWLWFEWYWQMPFILKRAFSQCVWCIPIYTNLWYFLLGCSGHPWCSSGSWTKSSICMPHISLSILMTSLILFIITTGSGTCNTEIGLCIVDTVGLPCLHLIPYAIAYVGRNWFY